MAGAGSTARLTRRIVTTVWAVACVVQIVIWVLIRWIGGSDLPPFWMWSLSTGGVVVLTWWLIERIVRAERGDQSPHESPEAPEHPEREQSLPDVQPQQREQPQPPERPRPTSHSSATPAPVEPTPPPAHPGPPPRTTAPRTPRPRAGSGAQQLVEVDAVTRTYGAGDSAVRALDDLSVGFEAGTFTAVMGPSGSGKSTLLQCAAGLDAPTSGRVVLVGSDLTGMDEAALTTHRRDHVGFIFQSFNLMPTLDVEHNITLPTLLGGNQVDKARVENVIATVGLQERTRHRPGELSGGQQQRVAIARALAAGVDVVFADEPTGALDSNSARDVLTLMRELVATGTTIVMVTHDPIAASYADSVLFLVDGRLVDELDGGSVTTIAERMALLGERAGEAGGRA